MRAVRWLPVLYGSGYLGVALLTYVVATWVAYAYAPPAGRGLPALLPVGLVGVAVVVGRVVDAVADPLVGLWSDATRSRWGRRLPFIALGTPPLALSFGLLWLAPPAWSDAATLAYLTLMLAAFFFFFTVVVAPYLALLPELAGGRAERLRLATWQGVFNVAGVLLAGLAAGPLIEALGFGAMGALMALVTVVAFAVPALTVRAWRGAGSGAAPGRSADAAPGVAGLRWTEALRLTLANRPFRYYAAGQVCFWFGLNAVMAVTPYVVTVLMGGSEADASVVLGAAMGVSLLSFPLVARWAGRRGNAAALRGAMSIFAVVLALVAGVGRLPVGLGAFAQGTVLVACAGLPLAALFVLPNALIAEVTDLDRVRTGMRREAVYYGLQGLAVKTSIGLSSLVVTLLLGAFGYSPGADLGVRLVGPVAAVAVLAGVLLFRPYASALRAGHKDEPASPGRGWG